MNDAQKLYLKPNVVAEPLVCQWYAWTHLISPATAARNVTERHLSIMKSYLQAPQVHQAAVKNPKMLGGPFMDYEGNRTAEVRELLARTRREQAPLLELSEAIAQLDRLLEEKATGFSLEPLYDEVPEPLQGLVELVYDRQDHPSFRLIEPLLYASRYYDPSTQSIALWQMDEDSDRPFALSTPRLPDQGFQISIPFADRAIDALFRMKREPRPLAEIQELLGVGAERREELRQFFTEREPEPYAAYTGDAVRMRYFGHACILTEARGVNVLTDPVISYEYHSDLPRYTYSDLPEHIHYVLITHNHQDHILLETMLQLRHKVGTVIVPRCSGGALQDPSLKLCLQRIGFDNVLEMDEMESVELEGVRITSLPFLGEHADLDIRSKAGFLVDSGERSMMFLADSCNVAPHLYRRIHQMVGDVDVLFLGMECDGAPLSWLYGPLITRSIERRKDQSRRLSGSNYERGIDIVERFNCRESYVYAMGQEPWLDYIMAVKYSDDSNPIVASNRLLEDCRCRGIVAERLFGEREILLDPVLARAAS